MTERRRRILRSVAVCLASGLLVLTGGCDFEGSNQGVRSPCSTSSGSSLECESPPIDTPEDACWRMVHCGAIPLENPEDQPDAFFDWPHCVAYIEDLARSQRSFTLACVEGAACDQLEFEGSPVRPTRNSSEFPPCLQHGDP